MRFLRYRVWQTGFFVILDHFLPFTPLTTFKKNILKKWKKTPGDIIILQMCNINDNHVMYGSWDLEHDRQNFFVILDLFLPYFPLTTQKTKFWKNDKNTWRYYHFTCVYHKWQSYDVSFLRYGAWWAEFFVILGQYLPFYPTNNPENQNFEKWKKHPEILSSYTFVTHMTIIYCMVPKIWNMTDSFFCHFGPFFTLLPH